MAYIFATVTGTVYQGGGCRIYQLYLCKEIRPLILTIVLNTTLNHFMIEECVVPFYSYHYKVYPDAE